MYHEKLVTGLFLSMILIGAASAVNICPFDPISPTEAATTFSEGTISNGGIVNGILFLDAYQSTGITGNVTGYASSVKSLVGSGSEIAYADTTSTDPNLLKIETGISLTGGRLTYGESSMYSYATPNITNDEYEPFCEQAISGVWFSITNGQYASNVDMNNMISTNIFTHDTAIEGTGTFTAYSGYGIMQKESFMFNGDRLTAIGNMSFARNVHFKSIKP